MSFTPILLFLSKVQLLSKTNNPKQEEENILHRIREDADAALRDIYKLYRNPFLNWSAKYFNLDESTASDIFQDIVIAFYKNVTSLKLHTLEASLKTYLFSIGKHLLLKQHRQKQKENIILMDDFSQLNLNAWDLDISVMEEQSVEEEKIIAALELLGKKCRQLLKMFYFEGVSHKEIVRRMEYNSLEVSRSMKRKCIKNLKKIMQQR